MATFDGEVGARIRRLRATLAAAVIAGAGLLVTAAPAHAVDVGNGNVTCDAFEICFRFNSEYY